MLAFQYRFSFASCRSKIPLGRVVYDRSSRVLSRKFLVSLCVMRYVVRYFYHFLVSNSRHGTHSPFVYALADSVIYNPHYQPDYSLEVPPGFNPSYFKLLQKILAFWKVDKISADLQDQDSPAFWLDSNDRVDMEQVLEMVHRGKVCIVHAPYSRGGHRVWKQLIQDPRVIVSLNLFHFGMLIHRQGQTKENFLLRYPLF